MQPSDILKTCLTEEPTKTKQYTNEASVQQNISLTTTNKEQVELKDCEVRQKLE